MGRAELLSQDPQGCAGPTEPPGTPEPCGGGAGSGAVVLCTPAREPLLLLPAPARLPSASDNGC